MKNESFYDFWGLNSKKEIFWIPGLTWPQIRCIVDDELDELEIEQFAVFDENHLIEDYTHAIAKLPESE